jgi:uncharacterized protein YbaA (DUF1428 family)
MASTDLLNRLSMTLGAMRPPSFSAFASMPFDGKRMIFGGFAPVVTLGQ